jgi:hypothetical protein
MIAHRINSCRRSGRNGATIPCADRQVHLTGTDDPAQVQAVTQRSDT